MKLIRFGETVNEKTGLLLDNEERVDTSGFGEDYNEKFFQTDGVNRLSKWFSENKDSLKKVDQSVRWAAPICRPSKIICVGLNFKDHAEESKMKAPEEPVLFFKSTSAYAGPYDDLMIPKGAKKVDWEVEFAFVVGKKASYVSKEAAYDYIAGYAIHSDFSEREFQLERSGQWVKGKSCDTFAPFGPFVATRNEMNDISDLKMTLSVNGVMKQNGTTENLIFDVPTLLSYISRFMTLLPGDIVSTGTPAGVGLGMNPPEYLKEGDVVEAKIDALGISRQNVIPFKG